MQQHTFEKFFCREMEPSTAPYKSIPVPPLPTNDLMSSALGDPQLSVVYCNFCGQRNDHWNTVYRRFNESVVPTCRPGYGCSRAPLPLPWPTPPKEGRVWHAPYFPMNSPIPNLLSGETVTEYLREIENKIEDPLFIQPSCPMFKHLESGTTVMRKCQCAIAPMLYVVSQTANVCKYCRKAADGFLAD